jgi:hypothetical protein
MKNSPKGKAKLQPVAIAKPEKPRWIMEDGPRLEYRIACSCTHAQEVDVHIIELSRAEYIALKVHLARFRGVEVDAETERDLMEDAA